MASTKPSKAKGAVFKISTPRIRLSTSGVRQTPIRKIAGISIPTSHRSKPVLTA